MLIQDWLMEGNPNVTRLVKQELFGESSPLKEDGWIKAYLLRYQPEKKQWGNGIYSPKWDSTFYTLLELKELGIAGDQAIYQEGVRHLLHVLWSDAHYNQDICIVAMMISMASHAKIESNIIEEMVHYILVHQINDGGFNCECTRKQVHSSSIHTTLSVLIAFSDLRKYGYIQDDERYIQVIKQSEEFLLRKHLLRRESNHELIQSQIIYFHYPTRWKYDVLKALLYFAREHVPYDPRMKEALQLLKDRFRHGKLPKGPMIAGRIHFPLESEDVIRMNTYRGLVVLKEYDQEFYQNILKTEIKKG